MKGVPKLFGGAVLLFQIGRDILPFSGCKLTHDEANNSCLMKLPSGKAMIITGKNPFFQQEGKNLKIVDV